MRQKRGRKTIEQRADEVLRHGDRKENAFRLQNTEVLFQIGCGVVQTLRVVLRIDSVQTSLVNHHIERGIFKSHFCCIHHLVLERFSLPTTALHRRNHRFTVIDTDDVAIAIVISRNEKISWQLQFFTEIAISATNE